MSSLTSSQEIGLYIHWPFCVKKCHYCDLNSHVRSNVDYEAFVKALCDEIQWWASENPSFIVRTIFIGGGTPSLMAVEWIDKILNTVRSSWNCDLVETTIEANPSITECANLADLRQIGVDRISFGVQSFDDGILQALGRTHTAAQARQLIAKSLTVFDKVSIDLMYGLPGQNISHINQALDEVLAFGLRHVSFYDLTIEPNTSFGQLYKNNMLYLPPEEEVCDAYWTIVNRLTDAGMKHYEISNFAFDDAVCHHNMIYWLYKDFLGIGAGAHSRIRLNGAIHEVENHKLPEAWIESVNKKGAGWLRMEQLDAETIQIEKILMRARIAQGFSQSDMETLFDNDSIEHKVDNLILSGNAIRHPEGGFGLNSHGFLRYNSVLKYLNN